MGMWDDTKQFLFGGGATQGMSTQPKTATEQRMHLRGLLANNAPEVGQVSSAQADQTRGQQGQLAGMLFNTATGNTPGAGEMAVNRQIGQANAAQTSQASMARGANAALAMRQAARNQAAIGVDGAGQAGIAQLNDRTAAQNQLSGLLGGMRGQDLGQRGQDIGIAQGNQQASLAQEQLKISALAQMLGIDEATLRQDMAKRQLDSQDKGMFGSLLQVGGQIGAAYAGAPGAGGAAATPSGPVSSSWKQLPNGTMVPG